MATPRLSRRGVLALFAALPLASALPAGAAPLVQVFKNPSCSCCTGWADHLKAAGFSVKVAEVDDTAPVRKRLGIPEQLGSCHTATVDGYALEGHVPAAEVKRLLKTRPSAIGLAVPGMPMGSPGMETGGAADRYEVLLVDRAGGSAVFARYPK